MALTSFVQAATPTSHHQHHHTDDRQERKRRKRKKKKPSPPGSTRTLAPPSPSSSSSSSWEQFKSLLSCRSTAASQVHDPSSTAARLGRAACGSSICALRDVLHGNTRVVHRPDTDLSSSAGSVAVSQHETPPLAQAARSARHHPPVSSVGCGGYSRGGMQLPKLSGCYECRAVSIEPSSRRYPRPRTTLCACSECGEVFTKQDSLELHRALRHAVSELEPEDSGRNIVEIIFKSSWQKKDRPICQIERILKVHNAPRTVARFEDYRAAVKSRALPHLASTAGGDRHHHPSRCAADGNELLRFHCASLSCSLGARGSTSLCSNCSSSSSSASSSPGGAAACGVCTIIRHGFARAHGVRTTASSSLAHDRCPAASVEDSGGEQRAMLVCRVIAGRVRLPADDPVAADAYDSVAVGDGGESYGHVEELLVANPRAILPCFVVIYRALS
ncbi:C2H2 zinc finger protein [Musa troglodytarum]|uniref:C2H2 zinc finger protein n=1 Tax=Musa troglodytarum TaxID=320322 RepID=A0A9E7KP79_9LILI|nr:C2H2 zinc finger protein [Musa troglodytarum]